MKVPEFELLNPIGFMVDTVGRVHSPHLKDICKNGYKTYQYALSMLLMTPKDYMERVKDMLAAKGDRLPDFSPEEVEQLDIFTLLTIEESTRADVMSALGFFIDGPFEYEPAHKCILVNPTKDEAGNFTVDGMINSENWTLVCDVCLQCANIDPPKDKKEHKYKDERTRKKFEEFYRKKAEYEKNKRGGKKADPDYELPNIISAVANEHNSLNMANIWDLTVYQVHDTFNRLRIKKVNDISDFNYSVWGGKDHQMDAWYKHMS